MDLLCLTNQSNEQKTPQPSPLEDSAEVEPRKLNATLRDAMASSAGVRKKKGNNYKHAGLLSAADVVIPILIREGAQYDGEHFIWPSGHKTKPKISNHGYLKVAKNIGNQVVALSVARFVCWKANGAPPPDKPYVDHINRIRTDNRPENLRWASASENTRNATREPWTRELIDLPRYGKFDGNINFDVADDMRALHSCGHSIIKLSERFVVSRKAVADVLTMRTWVRPELRQKFRARVAELEQTGQVKNS